MQHTKLTYSIKNLTKQSYIVNIEIKLTNNLYCDAIGDPM